MKKNCKYHYCTSCYRDMPDSEHDCSFQDHSDCKYYEPTKETETNVNVAIEGVGRDAEIVVNEKGGMQSKTPIALHLVDPFFLMMMFEVNDKKIEDAILHITNFMRLPNKEHYKSQLIEAIKALTTSKNEALIRISKVLQEGVEKYEPNNWRLIPQEQHLNHALIHLLAAGMGDTQDNHLEHALCRLMMAYATDKSPNFSYTQYVKPEE